MPQQHLTVLLHAFDSIKFHLHRSQRALPTSLPHSRHTSTQPVAMKICFRFFPRIYLDYN